MRDIGDRKQAEEKLRQYKHIVASSTDMMALIDSRYVYHAVNDAYAKSLQKSTEDLIGQTVANVFGGDFFEEIIKPNTERCLAGKEVHYQAWFEKANHEKHYRDITYFPYINEHGKVEGLVVHSRDITDRKQAEAKLLAAERMQAESERLAATGRLAARVAHEINNPLAGIKNSFRLIKDAVAAYLMKPLDFGELLMHIRTALKSSQRRRMISSIMEKLKTCQADLDTLKSQQRSNQNDDIEITLGTIRTLASCLSELLQLQTKSNADKKWNNLCELLDCPHHAAHRQAILNAIEILKGTKDTFKSKSLAKLREQLECVISHVRSLKLKTYHGVQAGSRTTAQGFSNKTTL